MTKNLISLKEFKKKAGNSVNENVIVTEDTFKVRRSIDIPASLVKAYIKKCKDTGSKEISTTYSEVEIAEILADYVSTKYMNIENFPVSILLGTDFVQTPVQAEATDQVQTPAQPVQAAPVAQAPVQETPAAPATPESTAQVIPAKETPAQPAKETPAQAI